MGVTHLQPGQPIHTKSRCFVSMAALPDRHIGLRPEQIKRAINDMNSGKTLRFKRPHKGIDVWMDTVLLVVLKHWPQHGPSMFSRMATGLSGEEFIRFMSGQATWRLRLKVMMTMPKWPFIRGVSKLMFQRPRKVVA